MMNLQERQATFNKAIACYRFGRTEESRHELRRLVDDGSCDPKHLSFYGLVVATSEGKVMEGLEFCERALTLDYYNPEMHLNLAHVYAAGGSRERAVHTLLRGLRLAPKDLRLHHEIRRLRPRSRPVVAFLRRSHPLNKYLGLARHRLSKLLGAY